MIFKTYFQFKEEDGLPDNICKDCISKCYSWFDFKNQCETNEEFLRDILIKSTINLKVDSIVEVETNQDDAETNETEIESNNLTDAEYYNSENESIHNEIVIGNTESTESKACPHCDKYFRKEERLEAHINLVHLGKKAVTCKLCNSGFSNMGNLKRHHMLQHSQVKQKKHVCTECNKAFNYSSSLSKHMRIHQNIRNYICDHCAKSFVHKTGLQSHLLTHSTETPFPCPTCDRQFKSNGMLQIHIRRHKNLKTFW